MADPRTRRFAKPPRGANLSAGSNPAVSAIIAGALCLSGCSAMVGGERTHDYQLCLDDRAGSPQECADAAYAMHPVANAAR